MKIIGKGKGAKNAEAAINKIVEAFKAGNLPDALSDIYLNVNRNQPSGTWSIRNQLIQMLMGATDGRTYNQWREVGRCVRKGGKSFSILAPVIVNDKERKGKDGKPLKRLIGFRGVCEFDIGQTDVVDADLWEANKGTDAKIDDFMENLPLREVAESWGLDVSAVSAKASNAKGWYMRGQAIGIGVANLATWAHELVHAADDKKGNLTEHGQHWRSECVAELGGATLLMALGYETEADLGGAYQYVERYAKDAKLEPVDACVKVLTRTIAAVSLILEEAAKLAKTDERELIPA